MPASDGAREVSDVGNVTSRVLLELVQKNGPDVKAMTRTTEDEGPEAGRRPGSAVCREPGDGSVWKTRRGE